MPKIHQIRYAKTPLSQKSGTETITAAAITPEATTDGLFISGQGASAGKALA